MGWDMGYGMVYGIWDEGFAPGYNKGDMLYNRGATGVFEGSPTGLALQGWPSALNPEAGELRINVEKF